MPGWLVLLALAGAAAAAALLYWLIILTEGVYLGPGAVTALYNRFARRYDAIKQFDADDEAFFLGRPIARFLAGLSDAQDPDTPPAGPAHEPAAEAPPWLLDVATGTGRLPLAVWAAAPAACRMVALDRAEAMLAEARRKLADQGAEAILLAHDANRLPFADGQFAVTTCLEALEFMPAPDGVLAELVRVTQSGGLLVLTNRIGPDARLLPGRTWSREHLAARLRELGAAGVEIRPWQVDYDLVFALRPGQPPAGGAVDWIALLRCPRCHAQPLPAQDEATPTAVCPACGWRLQRQNPPSKPPLVE